MLFKRTVAIQISLAEQGRRLFFPSPPEIGAVTPYFCQSLGDKELSHCYLNLHPHCVVWMSFVFILLGIWVGHAVISYSWPFPIFQIVFVFPCHFMWLLCTLQIETLFHLHWKKLKDASFIHWLTLVSFARSLLKFVKS